MINIKKMVNITVIILTYNEEENISHSVSNVIDWADEVIVLDSFSSDKTVEIAQSIGAKIHYRKFDNYAKQRLYAFKELPVLHPWILFLDADEFLTKELKKEIDELLQGIPKARGYYIKYRFIFLNKWIRFGGYYGTKIMRLFHKDYATINREMNEHILIDGITDTLKNDFIHEDRKGLNFWLKKHINYAKLEAAELINKTSNEDMMARLFGNQTQRKRWVRKYVWVPLMPPLIRPFIYFFYRFFLRLGFLDGKRGFIFHFLHGLWYIFLIDVFFVIEKMKLHQNSK